ncbi:MAG: type II toxin-antitoxin system prevent-host-death family antitoxin [Acidimicrobiaceae bacterium]|nr:type II toxin-antitoxin system prevent-host-death family antitoxin [Acidimicrobiaceae bacterium]
MVRIIGAYEAKTKLSALLREVKAGRSFTITNKGEVIADLVPSVSIQTRNRVQAVEKMKKFIAASKPVVVDIKTLIEEGRS